LRSAEFEVDVTSIRTNDSRRDSQVQRALDTSSNPTATFRLTEPLAIDTAAALRGERLSVTAVGDLTIAGTTRSVSFPLTAQLSGSAIDVAGSIDIVFADYGVSVPRSAVVVSVEDHGTLELELVLTRA
jgi:polyisoprenoid-binding protein YceI